MSASDAPARFDVCIVTWRTKELLRRCLRALAGQPEVGEIVVVDNASGDGTAEMVREEFPHVRLLVNAQNLGFAAGNNQAIRATVGARSSGRPAPFVLLLNPDTEVHPGALRILLDAFAEDPKIGAVAPQLLLPDGSVQASVRGFPEPGAVLAEALGLARLFPRLGSYRLRGWKHDTRRDVDQPMASAFAIRRAALEEVGLFDEDFPLYFNDVDLCYRLKRAGWRIVFAPEAKVTHVHGASTMQVRPQAIFESHRSLLRFYRKHYRGRVCPCAYATVITLTWLTMWPRALWARCREGSPDPAPRT